MQKLRFIRLSNPWQSLIVSFALLISAGMLMLKMPWVMHRSGLSWLDALFTSSSAVCVTGLTVVPTSGFNTAGQWTILLLIQLGAIGIMTLTTSFLLLVRGKIGLKHKLEFAQLQEGFSLAGTSFLLKEIVKITFIIELLGALLLWPGFLSEGFSVKQSAYLSVFHSVSAFCNAGFSPFDDSLTGMNGWIKLVVAFLIIMGGLGYLVIFELLHFPRQSRLSFHSKIVLITTVGLLISGILFLAVFDWSHLSLIDIFFQSVTARTAGFNTVDLQSLSYGSVFTLMLLMFIGASPGSTGGGIKTTVFFVIVSSIFSVLKGKEEVVMFHRTLSRKTIMKAFATATLYFFIITTGVLILLQSHELSFERSLFEAISAMGTVGLSLDVTPHLNEIGKWTIIALMFIGRVGPASFALATMISGKELNIKYPKAELY